MSYHFLDGYIYFKVACGDPLNSGARVAADSVPSFKVYEQNGTTALASANTAAFTGELGVYAGSFQTTAAAGFEEGKCYTIIVGATIATLNFVALIDFEMDFAMIDMSAIASANMAAFFENGGNPSTARVGFVTAAIDPWAVALPGSYAAGTAGNLLGNSAFSAVNIRAALGMAAANFDLQIGLIHAKTVNLPAAPAAVGNVPTAVQIANQIVTTSGTTPLLVDVRKVNNQTVTGTGTDLDPWRKA